MFRVAPLRAGRVGSLTNVAATPGSTMRIAIIGAGISGLSCAIAAIAGKAEVVVFEKSRGLGGRVASRRVEGTVVDHGTPQLPDIGAPEVRASLAAERHVIDRPTGALTVDGFVADPTVLGVGYPAGLTRLAKVMAEGVDVRTSTRVAGLREVSTGLEIGDEQGNTHGVFDAVVISAPAPQAADLLDRSPEPSWRAEALRAVTYVPCVVVIVGVRIAEPEWFLARIDAGPVASIAIETAKGRPALDDVVPIVARLTPAASAELLDASDEGALRAARPAIASVLGSAVTEPVWTQVKRWRYAEPTGAVDFGTINPEGTRVIVCGDATGAGVLAAEASGQRAATRALRLGS